MINENLIKRYGKEHIVKKEDLDINNHVNNVQYVQWIQDISEEHWLHCEEFLINKNYVWFVLSHFVEYKSPALEGEKLLIETFVESFDKTVSNRAVEIRNADTGKLIVKSLTRWCLINPVKNRPMRIPQEISDLNLC